MRLAVAIILTALAAGCTEEIGRGELRPDGSQFVHGGSLGAKKRPNSNGRDWWTGLFKARDTEKSPKPDFVGIRRAGSTSPTPDEHKEPRSLWDRLTRKPESSKPAAAPGKE